MASIRPASISSSMMMTKASPQRRRLRDCSSTNVTGGSGLCSGYGTSGVMACSLCVLRHVERRVGRVDRHQLLEHRVIVVVEARQLVTAERILRRIEQALVAIGAGDRRQVGALRPLLHQVIVGNKRASDPGAVERARLDAFPRGRGA